MILNPPARWRLGRPLLGKGILRVIKHTGALHHGEAAAAVIDPIQDMPVVVLGTHQTPQRLGGLLVASAGIVDRHFAVFSQTEVCRLQSSGLRRGQRTFIAASGLSMSGPP